MLKLTQHDNFATSKIVAAQHCPSFVNNKITQLQHWSDDDKLKQTLACSVNEMQAATVTGTPHLTCHHIC
jgi:hypothetical protein